MKILVSTILAAASIQPLAACDFCAVYTATEAHAGQGFTAESRSSSRTLARRKMKDGLSRMSRDNTWTA